jgi:hypothetical protein
MASSRKSKSRKSRGLTAEQVAVRAATHQGRTGTIGLALQDAAARLRERS